jgi:phosphatidylglycerol:prolipoprotein diacylglycerol transferase
MWVHNLDPVLVDLGPVEIRYYGLAYLLGALLSFWMLEKARKVGRLPLSEKDTSDLVLWLVLGVVLGSRLFYVLFYNFDYYFSPNWWKVIAVWEGGMSFHGGLFGILIACYWFCRRKGIQLLQVADVLAAPLMLALAFGRVANFINGELWGTPTDVLWCVVFPVDSLCRHPYQLYEALKRFVIFGWLVWLGRRVWGVGFIFWNFVLLEGLGRFFLDFFKDEGTAWVGQVFSVAMVLVAGWMLWKGHREDLRKI